MVVPIKRDLYLYQIKHPVKYIEKAQSESTNSWMKKSDSAFAYILKIDTTIKAKSKEMCKETLKKMFVRPVLQIKWRIELKSKI